LEVEEREVPGTQEVQLALPPRHRSTRTVARPQADLR
jgi:hypothetical protein